MFKLINLFLFLQLTLSSRVIGLVSSTLNISKVGPSSITDVYRVLYNTPKSTLFFNNVASTIQKDSIYINPNNQKVKLYAVSSNSGVQDKRATIKNNVNKTTSFKSASGKSQRGNLIGYESNFFKINNPRVGRTQQLLFGSFQLLSQASQVKPTYIACTAGAGSPITSNTEVTYQASGLSWDAFYTLQLNPDRSRANFSGYVKIQNRSRKNFTNTKLTLWTGSSRIITNKLKNGRWLRGRGPSQVEIFQNYFYKIKRNVNITEGTNKIKLFDTIQDAIFNKILSATIESGTNPQEVKFTTKYSTANPGRINLPAGTMRIFQKNLNGATQKLVEYTQQHTRDWDDILIPAANSSDFKAQYIVRNQNNIQLQMTNLASRRVFIELALKKRPNLQASYDEGYKGPRWKIVAEDLYRLQTTIPENSKSSLYWNEVKSN